MTGPEHYQVAESLVEDAGSVMNYEHGIYASMGTEERIKRQAAMLTAAQVHATLALAAATGLMHGCSTFPDWKAVAGTESEVSA